MITDEKINIRITDKDIDEIEKVRGVIVEEETEKMIYIALFADLLILLILFVI